LFCLVSAISKASGKLNDKSREIGKKTPSPVNVGEWSGYKTPTRMRGGLLKVFHGLEISTRVSAGWPVRMRRDMGWLCLCFGLQDIWEWGKAPGISKVVPGTIGR
jgi:hypothetical protein